MHFNRCPVKSVNGKTGTVKMAQILIIAPAIRAKMEKLVKIGTFSI